MIDNQAEKDDNGCVFCDSQKIEGIIVYENRFCSYIELNNKVLIGSGLVITKKHRRTVFDVSLLEWISFFFMMRKVKKYIDNKYSPDGYNIGWNINEVGGQEVFHVHMHIIPRYSDEPYAGKGIRYWLKRDDNLRQNTEI